MYAVRRERHQQVTIAVPDELVDALCAMHRPVMISHVVPDADALGSMLGMARAWMGDVCQPRVSIPEGSLSQRLTFMVKRAACATAAVEDFGRADGFVVLDTAKKPRANVGPELKQTDWSAGRPVINIDHHDTNTNFGDINWVVGESGSASELVYHLLRRAERPIDPVTASLLFAGIHTDTIGFSLPTTTASALHAAGDLVARGADVGDLGERLCRSQRQSEFDLLRTVYANTKREADGQIAYSHASYAEIHDAGCTAADIDDQINVPRSLDGVRLAMLFTEGNEGKTRINFRGSGVVTVIELAGEFKGGGHAQAAGAILDCPLQEAIDIVVPRAIEHLRLFPPHE